MIYDNFELATRRMFNGFGVLTVLVLAANLAFWGGLIYLGFWIARHFGLIG